MTTHKRAPTELWAWLALLGLAVTALLVVLFCPRAQAQPGTQVIEADSQPALGARCDPFRVGLDLVRSEGVDWYCDDLTDPANPVWAQRPGGGGGTNPGGSPAEVQFHSSVNTFAGSSSVLVDTATGLLRYIAADTDGDGRGDYVFAWDANNDGLDTDVDVQPALDACRVAIDAGSPSCHVELAAGTYEVDPDNNGGGNHGRCINPSGLQPHLCIERSRITLSGQGGRKSLLLKATAVQAEPYVQVNNASAFVRAAQRLSDITVRDLAIEGPGCQAGTTNGKGVRFVDCDNCRGTRLDVRGLSQSAFDFTRSSWSSFTESYAEGIGNYDLAGACASPTPQPCVYAYTDDGDISRGNFISDITCRNVGGPGINSRADQSIANVIGNNPYPSTPALFKAATVEQLAQTFELESTTDITASGVAFSARRLAAGSGNLRMEIQATDGGGFPDGTPIIGYNHCDATAPPCFETVQVASLNGAFDKVLFLMDDSAGLPSTRLTADPDGNPDYAWVLSCDGAGCLDNLEVGYNGDATTDMYVPGAALTWDGGAWNLIAGTPNSDTGFAVMDGFLNGFTVSNVTVAGTSAADAICMNFNYVQGLNVDQVNCIQSGGLRFGVDGIALAPSIRGVVSSWSRTISAAGAPAIKAGVHQAHGIITDVTAFGSGGTDACIDVRPFVQDLTLDKLNLKDCASSGMFLWYGTKRIRLSGSEISGTGRHGIELVGAGSTNPVLGEDIAHQGIQIVGNRITGVKEHGITHNSLNVVVEDLKFTDNTVTWPGGIAVRFFWASGSTRVHGPMVISGNRFVGWARQWGEKYPTRLEFTAAELSYTDNVATIPDIAATPFSYSGGWFRQQGTGNGTWTFETLALNDQGTNQINPDNPYRWINTTGNGTTILRDVPGLSDNFLKQESFTSITEQDGDEWYGPAGVGGKVDCKTGRTGTASWGTQEGCSLESAAGLTAVGPEFALGNNSANPFITWKGLSFNGTQTWEGPAQKWTFGSNLEIQGAGQTNGDHTILGGDLFMNGTGKRLQYAAGTGFSFNDPLTVIQGHDLQVESGGSLEIHGGTWDTGNLVFGSDTSTGIRVWAETLAAGPLRVSASNPTSATDGIQLHAGQCQNYPWTDTQCSSNAFCDYDISIPGLLAPQVCSVASPDLAIADIVIGQAYVAVDDELHLEIQNGPGNFTPTADGLFFCCMVLDTFTP